jgi:hypothetical protein
MQSILNRCVDLLGIRFLVVGATTSTAEAKQSTNDSLVGCLQWRRRNNLQYHDALLLLEKPLCVVRRCRKSTQFTTTTRERANTRSPQRSVRAQYSTRTDTPGARTTNEWKRGKEVGGGVEWDWVRRRAARQKVRRNKPIQAWPLCFPVYHRPCLLYQQALTLSPYITHSLSPTLSLTYTQTRITSLCVVVLDQHQYTACDE